jgi:hypothetical protein
MKCLKRRCDWLKIFAAFRLNPQILIWCTIPGGLKSGKPAQDYADWVESTAGRALQLDAEWPTDDAQKLKRYILLKDTTLRQDGVEIVLGAAILDVLEVSAWGYHTPTKK